jgi:hypothetical protein
LKKKLQNQQTLPLPVTPDLISEKGVASPQD